MDPIVLAAFPGLLFSVHPPARTHTNPVPVVKPMQVQRLDSCSTYIYPPANNAPIYYNGQLLTPELLHKLGPMAAPLLNSLKQVG